MKKIIGLFTLFLLLSCALESEFALPNDENIIPELIGEWYNVKNNLGTIKIQQDGEKNYKLFIEEDDEIKEVNSFSKRIKGYNIMNVKTEYSGKTFYMFFGITLHGDVLTFSEVNDQLHSKEFKSETELLKFFENNIERENFFVNSVEMKRK